MTSRRGTSNSNDRGSAAARRRRKQALLVRDGDGIHAPCWECGVSVTFSTMICDRKKPGKNGGRYLLSNLRVHCRGCSETQGARMANEARRWKEWQRRGLRKTRIDPAGMRHPHRWFVQLDGQYVGYLAPEPVRAGWLYAVVEQQASHWTVQMGQANPGLFEPGGHETMRAALYALLVECTINRGRKAA